MRTIPREREKSSPDLSAPCPRHHTHATKYCPDLRDQLQRRRHLQHQHQRERLARHRGRSNP